MEDQSFKPSATQCVESAGREGYDLNTMLRVGLAEKVTCEPA